MSVSSLRSAEIDTTFDDSKSILPNRVPRRHTFLRSVRCRILVIIGVLLTLGVIALVASTYTIAFTATKTSTSTTSFICILFIPSYRLSTAHIPYYQRITNSNDFIQAIYNVTAGGSSFNSGPGYGVGQYPSDQGPATCIDFSNTTCLNFGNVGQNISGATNTAGVGTGVHTIPSVGISIVQAIQFQSGNGSTNRDPLTITLEGSNATGTSLNLGSNWMVLYTGNTGLAPFSLTTLAWGDPQNFSNTQAFTAYRMIVTSQRGIDDCTEFAEMHLYGLV